MEAVLEVAEDRQTRQRVVKLGLIGSAVAVVLVGVLVVAVSSASQRAADQRERDTNAARALLLRVDGHLRAEEYAAADAALRGVEAGDEGRPRWLQAEVEAVRGSEPMRMGLAGRVPHRGAWVSPGEREAALEREAGLSRDIAAVRATLEARLSGQMPDVKPLTDAAAADVLLYGSPVSDDGGEDGGVPGVGGLAAAMRTTRDGGTTGHDLVAALRKMLEASGGPTRWRIEAEPSPDPATLIRAMDDLQHGGGVLLLILPLDGSDTADGDGTGDAAPTAQRPGSPGSPGSPDLSDSGGPDDSDASPGSARAATSATPADAAPSPAGPVSPRGQPRDAAPTPLPPLPTRSVVDAPDLPAGDAVQPLMGTWQQAGGPSTPDFAPGGYTASSLRFDADGTLLITRTYPSEAGPLVLSRRLRITSPTATTFRLTDFASDAAGDEAPASRDAMTNVIEAPPPRPLPLDLAYQLSGDQLQLDGKPYRRP